MARSVSHAARQPLQQPHRRRPGQEAAPAAAEAAAAQCQQLRRRCWREVRCRWPRRRGHSAQMRRLRPRGRGHRTVEATGKRRNPAIGSALVAGTCSSPGMRLAGYAAPPSPRRTARVHRRATAGTSGPASWPHRRGHQAPVRGQEPVRCPRPRRRRRQEPVRRPRRLPTPEASHCSGSRHLTRGWPRRRH